MFIVVSLIWASRHSLENALPVFAFFVVLMPLESRLVIPGVFDFNTMRLSLMTLLTLYLIKREPSTQDTIPLKWLMLLNGYLFYYLFFVAGNQYQADDLAGTGVLPSLLPFCSNHNQTSNHLSRSVRCCDGHGIVLCLFSP
jgi:hypothetical protein